MSSNTERAKKPENEKSPHEIRAQDKENVRQLLASMADVTWRMFAAPAILVPAGIFADIKLQTKPWLTVLATVAGLGISVALVRQQLRGGQ